MARKRPQFIKFEYILTGKGTRGGSIFALSYIDATERIKKEVLQEGESIHTLHIADR